MTAPSPRIEIGAVVGGGGDPRRSLPYAGRAHGSQGRLPLGRSRVSAGPCPAWSPLFPALPALCVSSVRSPRGAAGSGLSPAGRPHPVQHWTAPAAAAARYPESRRPLPSATAAFHGSTDDGRFSRMKGSAPSLCRRAPPRPWRRRFLQHRPGATKGRNGETHDAGGAWHPHYVWHSERPCSPLTAGCPCPPHWAAAPVVFALFRFCRIKLNKALRAL